MSDEVAELIVDHVNEVLGDLRYAASDITSRYRGNGAAFVRDMFEAVRQHQIKTGDRGACCF